jgi:hypothetical protein
MAARVIVSQTTQSSKLKDNDEPKGNGYLGALVLVAAIIPLPFLFALITIITYIWLGQSNMVIILGLIIPLVIWLLLAIPSMRFITAEGARRSDYEGLQREITVLENRLKVENKNDEAIQDNVIEHKKARDIVILDVKTDIDYINDRLKSKGLHWLSTGYVSLWNRINEADEAMITVLPCETVIESAEYEELRLKNSAVPDSENLLKLLEQVIKTLSSNPNCSTARADIRKVKAALHKFTNERWDGLVRARNQLMVTAFLTTFFTYILVVIAVLAKVPSMNTLDAMVFYFLGAIVGLFGRLYDERHADTVIDDYGLSMARIIVTPLISGLAALIGVLFVTTSSTIDTIYQITLQNLVFASVLGFAPNLLINILRSKSEDIKDQIKSASPSDQKSGKGE